MSGGVIILIGMAIATVSIIVSELCPPFFTWLIAWAGGVIAGSLTYFLKRM